MANPLYEIPGMAGYLASQDRRRAMGQQDMESNIQQIKLADLLNAGQKERAMQQELGSLTPEQLADPIAMRKLQIKYDPKAGLEPIKQAEETPFLKNARVYQGLVDAGKAETPLGKSLKGWLDKESAKESGGIDKAPTTRVIQSGNQKITQEWINGKWNNVAVGAEKTPAQLYREEMEARKLGDAEAKKAEGMGKATIKADIVISKVDDALKKTGFFTTGLTGAALSKIPGTKAYDLDKTIDTIKANIGFQELADMRAVSPTGGALGQVAVRELEFLQAAVASLDAGLSYDEKVKSLNQIKTHYQNWKNAVEGKGAASPTSPAGGVKFLGFE